MKKISFVLSTLLLLAPLTACSGKPEASDVEGLIKEVWSPCKLVKVTDVKKTNGIDHGKSYQIAISYKLELVRDVAEEEVWGSKIPKPVERDLRAPDVGSPQWEARYAELEAPRRAAEKRKRDFLDNNCPGPIAGSRQMPVLAFLEAFQDRHGLPLIKGDSAERVTELTMIKTENGWVAQ